MIEETTYVISKSDYEMLQRYKATRKRANEKAKELRKNDAEYKERRRKIEKRSYMKRLAKEKIENM